ncbi:hypothetical protein QTO34_017745 [Cnephaeus nilssonii]|uniref:Uncharacterized protein n=1 Tax=Cnephaeus nilssonii TaxID=3371016 RepID=A0AA40LQ43_CNENI|nr:hypothetical protein QTO34_017745 [Eptesicus nilssonii]
MEENKRLDIEFKTTVIRFFKNFMEKADKFNETLEDMKKDQLEIKHTLTEIKNIIQRPNSRLEDRKHQLKDLEYKEAKDTAPEKYEEKRIQKVEDSSTGVFADHCPCPTPGIWIRTGVQAGPLQSKAMAMQPIFLIRRSHDHLDTFLEKDCTLTH